MVTSYDVCVIGDDAASRFAAAAASRSGANVALVPLAREKTPPRVSISEIPNALWRRLDLHDFGLKIEPASARVSLMGDDNSCTTYRDQQETEDYFLTSGLDPEFMWADLLDEMAALAPMADLLSMDEAPIHALFSTNLATQSDILRSTQSCNDLIAEFFNASPLSTHICAHALSTTGLGGSEPGSAISVCDFLDETTWPARIGGGVDALDEALKEACEKYNVKTLQGPVVRVVNGPGKSMTLELAGELLIKTSRIFFADPVMAEHAGYAVSFGPTEAVNAAEGVLRLKLKKKISPKVADRQAVFEVVDDIKELVGAREKALMGTLSERVPLTFEFAEDGALIARTRYVPSRLHDDEGWRDWTGQDRQILKKAMIDRLCEALPELKENIRASDLYLEGTTTNDDSAPINDARHVYLQRKRHNAIAAAVALMDKALSDE